MFNFFKKDSLVGEGPEKKVKETFKSATDHEPALDEVSLTETAVKQPDFNQVLTDLRELVLLKSGHLSPLEIEQVSGMEIDELAAFLGEKKIALSANAEDLARTLEKSLVDLDNPSNDSWWREVANKTAVKSSLLALMLVLKFAPEAKALSQSNLVDKNINQSEEPVEFVNQISGTTYQVTPEDLKSAEGPDQELEPSDLKDLEAEFLELEKYSRLELINYYETDKDEISADNQAQIIEQFSKFLSKVTPDNFDMVMATEFRIFGSSDERPTTNQDWQGSNEKLSLARIAAAEKILQTSLLNYDFSSSGLSAEQIKKLQTKLFVVDIPESSNGPEKGVTYLTDLINPATDTYYQPAELEELKKTDPAAYLELLKACRRVSIDLLAPHLVEFRDLPSLNTELGTKLQLDKRILTNWEEYKHVNLLVDNSPSMNLSYQQIAELIAAQDNLGETNLNLATFSDRLNDFQELENKQQVVDFITKMDKDGNHEERAIHAVISALEKLPAVKDQDKNLILVATDEPLQGLDWDILTKLKDKSVEKNCQVVFIYAHNRHGEVARLVSAQEIIDNYEQATKQTLIPLIQHAISLEEGRMARYELTVGNISRVMENLLARDLKTKDSDRLLDLEQRLVTAQRQIGYSQLMIKNLQVSLEVNDLTELLNNPTVSQLIIEKNWQPRLLKKIEPLTLGQEISLQAELSEN